MLDLNKIYNENCLEGIKKIDDKSIDLILTDPPYLISKKSNFNKGGGNTKKYGMIDIDFGEWDKIELDWNVLLKEYHRVLKDGGTMIIFYDIFKIGNIKEIADELKFKQPRIGFWTKTNTVPINSKINYLSNCREYFLSMCKGKKGVFNSVYDKATYSYPIVGGKERTKHTTQKPVKLFEDLIKVNSNEGDVILDTFIGSGTTAISSINTNRKYIGFELDNTYYNLANERINKIKE